MFLNINLALVTCTDEGKAELTFTVVFFAVVDLFGLTLRTAETASPACLCCKRCMKWVFFVLRTSTVFVPIVSCKSYSSFCFIDVIYFNRWTEKTTLTLFAKNEIFCWTIARKANKDEKLFKSILSTLHASVSSQKKKKIQSRAFKLTCPPGWAGWPPGNCIQEKQHEIDECIRQLMNKQEQTLFK